MSRTSKILFGISVAINILLVFFVAGRALHFLSPEAFFRKQEQEFLATLPPERARALEPRIQTIRERHRGMIEAIGAGRTRLVEIMTAPVFDESAFRQELGKVNALRDGLFDEISDIIIVAVKDLDVESRKKVAAYLESLPPVLPGRKSR